MLIKRRLHDNRFRGHVRILVQRKRVVIFRVISIDVIVRLLLGVIVRSTSVVVDVALRVVSARPFLLAHKIHRNLPSLGRPFNQRRRDFRRIVFAFFFSFSSRFCRRRRRFVFVRVLVLVVL